jgi:hypothetical protein
MHLQLTLASKSVASGKTLNREERKVNFSAFTQPTIGSKKSHNLFFIHDQFYYI